MKIKNENAGELTATQYGEIHAMDSNVEEVRRKLLSRSATGIRKYGTTTERTDLTRKQWLIHAQEEALDLAIYLQRLINDEL